MTSKGTKGDLAARLAHRLAGSGVKDSRSSKGEVATNKLDSGCNLEGTGRIVVVSPIRCRATGCVVARNWLELDGV